MAENDSWELGVAIPVKNNKFSFGTIGNGVLTSPLTANESTGFLFNNELDYIHNSLQYNDVVLLGPSTNSSNLKEMEEVIVSGIELRTGLDDKIHIRDKNNQKLFNANDPFTFYGTGLSGNWEIVNDTFYSYVQAEGLRRGLISKQQVGTFSEITEPYTTPGQYIVMSTGLSAYAIFCIPSSEYGVGLNLLNSTMDYIKAPLKVGTLYKTVEFGLINHSMTGTQYMQYGDYHRGGWRKDFAQRIRLKLGSDTPSGVFFKQNLIDFGSADSSNIREKTTLIPYAYYRMGGTLLLEQHHNLAYNSDYNINAVVYPNSNVKSEDEVIRKDILNGSGAYINRWSRFQHVQLLESGISNISEAFIGLEIENNISTPAYVGDTVLYLDELWLEHSGGVKFGDEDGCLKFNRFYQWPEENSLTITNKEKGEFGLAKDRILKVVTAKFNYCSQVLWDQIELLLSWQDRGYLLNLHPNIDDLEYTLTGKLTVKDYKKDHWDLSLRSFTLEFEEVL